MNPQSLRLLFFSFLLCFSYQSVLAQDVYYSRQNGSWNNPDTWSFNGSHSGLPNGTTPGSTSGNIVIISAGHVVDYNAFAGAGNSATIATLAVGTTTDGAGTLRFPFSNYNGGANGDLDRLNNGSGYTLIVTGNVDVANNGSILSVEGGSGTPTMNGTARNEDHFLFIRGDLTNQGTIDLEGSTTNRIVNLVFNGAGNQTIFDGGALETWDTYNITYSSDDASNQITNRSENFTASIAAGRSTFTQGTYVHDNASTYNNQNNSGTDYDGVSFIIQNGVFNMVVGHTGDRNLDVDNGSITVTGGQFNSGGNVGNVTNLTVDGDVIVSGTGVMNIGDGDPGTSTTPTDGTLTISGGSSLVNGTTLYTYDLTLNAGANLSLENGATVSVGEGTGGSITMNGVTGNGSSLTISDATSALTVAGRITVREDCSLTINNGNVDIASGFTTENVNPVAIFMDGDNASLTMLDGTLDASVNSNRNNNIDALALNAANVSIDIQGGTVTLGNATTGEGNIDFRQGAGETASLSISNSANVTVGDRIERGSVGSISNITLSNNATLLVGTDNSSGNVDNFFHEGTLSIANNATARFGVGGDLGSVTITENGTLETGTTGGGTVDINGTFTYGSATATCTFFQGMDIELDANLNISAGTINILPNATTASDTRMRISGNLTMDGGTINLGASITDITNGNLLQVFDEGTFTINAGTFSMLASPALTSLANRNPFNITNDDTGLDATQGDGVVTIGDGSGGANTAQLIIAPNLAAELPSPTTRNILDMDGANSILIINSDGYLGVGGGNIGNLRLNTNGAQFVMNGGTCDITASLTIDDGTSVEVNGGTLNVGTSSSNGTNRIIYSQGNPTAITSLTLNNGTINVGDGNSQLIIGNDNETPAFGTTDAFSILEITGGTLNLNGSFNLDDANARLVMGSGNFNLNPQGDQNLDSDIDIFDLEQGIANMSGGTVTILNPHAVAGSGYAVNISDVGNGDNRVSGSTGPTATAITFGTAFRFGDGSASATGSEDGFDLNLSDDHTYGSFIANNPSGNNRQVEFINSTTYNLNGSFIIAAGTMDINTNIINGSSSGVFSLSPTGRLIIGNTDGADHFPGSVSPFNTYSVDAVSTVEYDGGGNALVTMPGGAQFGNLIISGSGTKTLDDTETVRSTLTLASGTFASGTSLIMGAGSTVLRTDGVMTGTIQGINAYTITYESTTKTSQIPEWSGGGSKSLIVNLDASETLTLHNDLVAQGGLNITEGILADAGFTLTVGGNVINSSLHTGTGRIYLTGSVATRSIGGDGTGQFENLELDDANGAIFTAAQTVNSLLTLTSGVLDIDNFLLSLPTTATVNVTSPSATTMIQINSGVGAAGVQKAYVGSGTESFTWPIGSNGKYTPATVEVINATNSGTVTLNPVDAENPFTTDAADVSLGYYWIISRSGFGFETANLSFTYDQTDADGRGNESAYVPARYFPTTWNNINNVALVDETTNTISFNNVTYIEGQFTAAEPSEFGTVLTYFSRADGNWNTANSWSTVALGGAAASTIPGSSTPVIIGNNNTITISNNNTTAPSVELQATGTILVGDATTGHDLGTVSGEGTLSIETNDTDATEFPSGTYTDFLGATGGTVEYTGTGSYTALSTLTAFRNLIISGSGTVILPDANLTLLGDLAINGPGSPPNLSVLISNTTNGNLTIGGNLTVNNSGAILQFQPSTNRSVTVTGDVTNTGTLQVVDASFATHSLSIGGSLTNNRTLDLSSSTGLHRANVTFTGATNTSITGTGGTTDFYRLIVNKGTDTSSELEVTSTNFMLSAPTNSTEKALEIQNGTLKLSAAHTITLSTGGGSFSIPSSGGLWINNVGAVAEISSASSDLSLAGLLRLADGAINIGDDITGVAQNSIFYAPGNATITVEGGTLTVGGAIRPNPDAATLSYDQSGGTVVIANNRSSSESINNNSEADFCIETGSGSSFTMSDGLLEIVRRNSGADGKAIRVNNGTSHTVTGGTVRILNSSTATNFDVGITSSAPFWNLEIGDGNSFTERVGASNGGEQDLTVLNDLTINLTGGGEFHLYRTNSDNTTQNEIDLDLGGSLTLTNGTFEAGNPSVVTFNGSGLSGQTSPQVISGSLTFHSVNINNTSGSVQLNNSINLAGDWTYTTGTFNQNTHLVTFSGTTNQTINGNPFSFDDIVINNSAGVTLGTSQLTINGDLDLTDGNLNLGSNLLSVAATATISTPTSFGSSRMITTTGENADQGVEKAYTSNTTFLFPLGTATEYTPASLALTNHGSSGNGSIRVSPVDERQALAPAGTSLLYYWVTESSGFSAAPAITHVYTYDDPTDVDGDETNYVDAYFDGTDWVTDMGSIDDAANTITVSTTDNLSGYFFTAGVLPFSPPIIYYSKPTGTDWNIATTWNTAADGTGSDGIPGATNPVVIQLGHTVTIPTGLDFDMDPIQVTAATTTIESTGVLDIQETNGAEYDIGTVVGTGTLRFTVGATPDVPTLDNDFVNAGGGTVEYNYTANRDLPTSQTTYNNLAISGIRRYNHRADYTINGNLSITTEDRLEDNGFTFSGTPSGTLTVSGDAELRVEGTNSFPSGFGTYDLQSGSLVRYQSNNDQTVASLDGDSYWDLVFNNRGTKTLSGNIIIDDDLAIGERAVLSALSFDINIRGDWNRDSRNGSAFLPGTGTVIFDGTTAQEIDRTNTSSAETFGNITINNSAGVNLDNGGTQVTQLDITGNLTFTVGTLGLQNKPFTISGNLINNVASTSVITNASTVTFNNASANQEVNGTNGVDLENITLAKASGTTLTFNIPVSISGTLDMQNDGNIVLSGTTNNLTFGSSATISGSFSSNRMIVNDGTSTASQVIKQGDATADSYDFTFPIGAGSNYTPVTIDATAIITAGGSIGVRSVNGNGNYPLVDATRVINRHFLLNLSSITDITGSLAFTYTDSDVQGSEINYLSWVYNGSSLNEVSNGFVTPGTNTFGSTDITVSDATTEWVAGEAGAFFSRLYSQRNGLWSNNTNVWNTAADGSGIFATPNRFNEVEIQNNHTITTDANDQDAAALIINGTLEINGTMNHDFGPITGADSLIINNGVLPGFNVLGTTFFDNGTVEYTGAAYTLPSEVLSYNNLIISGTDTKILPANITVTNDLTIDGVTLDADNTNNYNISLGGDLNLLGGGALDPRAVLSP
ncbi:MAG: hypothetical protein AAF632_01870 [Bacteroidota bacterium]